MLLYVIAVMPEGEKELGVPVVIGGDYLFSLVGIGLTDLPNIGGPVDPLPRQVPASLHFILNRILYILNIVKI